MLVVAFWIALLFLLHAHLKLTFQLLEVPLASNITISPSIFHIFTILDSPLFSWLRCVIFPSQFEKTREVPSFVVSLLIETRINFDFLTIFFLDLKRFSCTEGCLDARVCSMSSRPEINVRRFSVLNYVASWQLLVLVLINHDLVWWLVGRVLRRLSVHL